MEFGVDPKRVAGAFMLPFLILMSVVFFFLINTDPNIKTLTYSDLLKEIDWANIQKITFYSDGRVDGQFKSPRDGKTHFVSNIGEGDSAFLSRKLEGQNLVPEIIKQTSIPSLWVTLLPIILLLGFFFFMVKMSSANMKNGVLGSLTKSEVKQQENLRPVTFRDVAGVDEAKEELKEIVDFIDDPKKYTRLGGRIPKGVLLVGPPRVGKTLLARAVAGEAKVPFYIIAGSNFVELFVGVGAGRVRSLFKTGKSNSPCIIFIDEIDAVGRHRGTGMGGNHDEREQTLNQLLVEMDGFEINAGVVIIAATNRPDVLDPALLRPGRF